MPREGRRRFWGVLCRLLLLGRKRSWRCRRLLTALPAASSQAPGAALCALQGMLLLLLQALPTLPPAVGSRWLSAGRFAAAVRWCQRCCILRRHAGHGIAAGAAPLDGGTNGALHSQHIHGRQSMHTRQHRLRRAGVIRRRNRLGCCPPDVGVLVCRQLQQAAQQAGQRRRAGELGQQRRLLLLRLLAAAVAACGCREEVQDSALHPGCPVGCQGAGQRRHGGVGALLLQHRRQGGVDQLPDLLFGVHHPAGCTARAGLSWAGHMGESRVELGRTHGEGRVELSRTHRESTYELSGSGRGRWTGGSFRRGRRRGRRRPEAAGRAGHLPPTNLHTTACCNPAAAGRRPAPPTWQTARS